MNRKTSEASDMCNCGGFTEVLKRVRTGLIVRRYRRCLRCKKRFKTAEVKESESQKNNYGKSWPAISKAIRLRDHDTCQVCLSEKGPKLPVDHIIPFRLSKCNDPQNLITLGPVCHAAKRRAEDHLKRGDRLGFDRELRALGWNMDRVGAAFEAWGNQTKEIVTAELKRVYQ